MVEAAAVKALGQVTLVDPALRVVVRVEVGAILVRAGAVAVAQVVGHLAARTLADLGQSGVDAGLAGI